MARRSTLAAFASLGALVAPFLHPAPAFAAAPPAVVDVYAGSDLQAVVRNATSGQTIVVHSGTYGSIWVGDKSLTTPAVVTAAPGEDVTVASFTLLRVTNLTVSGVAVSGLFQVRTSHGITIDHDRLTSVQLRDGTTDSTVTDSRIVDGGDGIWVHDINTSVPNDHITIARNDIAGQTDDAITLGATTNAVIEDNLLHDTVDTANHNDGVQITGGSNIVVQRNRMWNHDEAVMVKAEPSLGPADASVSGLTIRNNLIHGTRGAGVIVAGGTSGTTVVANTITNDVWADLHLEGTNTGLRAFDNVLGQIYRAPGTTTPDVEDFNCVRTTGATGARDITADPAFVDTVDFRLSSSSPCRGTGTGTIDGTPVDDLLGAERHDPWDMGAYQDSSTAPLAPEVYPSGSLDAAVRQAVDGTTIVVHDGTYPALSLTGFTWPTGVVLSAAPGEHPVVAGIDLDHVSGLHLRGISVSGALTARSSDHLAIADASLASVSLRDGTHDVTVSGNDIGGGAYGVSAGNASGAPHVSGLVVVGNTIHDVATDAIQLASADASAISGNVLLGATDTTSFQVGVRVQGASGLTISANTVTGFDQSMTLKPATGLVVEHVRVENDVVSRSRGSGVLIDSTNDVVLANDTVLDSTGADVHLQASNAGLVVRNVVAKMLYRYNGAAAPSVEDYNAFMIGAGGSHDIRIDPQITDRVTYHPSATSPLLGAGTSFDSPTVDRGGASRDGAITIGAWQSPNSP